MLEFLLLFSQSLLFVMGVYTQKFLRRQLYSREKGKRIKQTSRIVICTIMTAVIIMFNYQMECSNQLGLTQCFYFSFDLVQCLHVIIANTLLFSTHLYSKISSNSMDLSRYNFKSVVAAPFLQEMLFRASFYRVGHDSVPTFLMALIFSISHFHRPIRKWIKGKDLRWGPSLFQVLFTLIFGIYSFWFLVEFKSVIPSILLHCYCNFLGPPAINKQNLPMHCLSILSLIAYCTFVI